jgi:pimeloyl-ACP methyl ester carboxylesterase
MSKYPQSIWINTNPSFQRFNQSFIRHLCQQTYLAQWDYIQNQDEPSSLDIALTLLHDYIKSLPESINLIGHSTGGLLGLLYARKYPERVKSLILLGVGFHPAIDWQIHYYTMRNFLSCSQEMILAQMVQKLFGHQEKNNTKALITLLKQDLNTSPSPHSLYQKISITPGRISMPLMICGSEDDSIVDRHELRGWKTYLKEDDILWECPQGHHFFQYFYPEKVSRQIIKFWHNLEKEDSMPSKNKQATKPC